MQIVNTKLPNENLQTYQLQMIDFGGGVNYQMQIVKTKLPNENPQTYQVQMTNSGGERGKLPNANCGHQTLTDLGGCAGHTPSPMGPNSFVFAYIFTKKCLHQRSMPLLMGAHSPMGNPGSTTAKLPIAIPSTTNIISHVKLKK